MYWELQTVQCWFMREPIEEAINCISPLERVG